MLRLSLPAASADMMPLVAEETTFHLLSLSLYREYINLEFVELRQHNLLSFEYDLERVR